MQLHCKYKIQYEIKKKNIIILNQIRTFPSAKLLILFYHREISNVLMFVEKFNIAKT